MKKSLVLSSALVLLMIMKSYSQSIHIAAKDYEKMFNRKLVVELLEEDIKVVKHLEKASKKHPEHLVDYRNFIARYNQYVKIVVDKFWTLNKPIEYKTKSEIKPLISAKDTSYMVLYYSESSEQFVDYKTNHYVVLPTLNYTRMEHHNKKIDYSVHLPVSFLRPNDAYIESDLIFAVQLIQINLDYNKNNEKKYNAATFAKHQGHRVKDLESKTLLLDHIVEEDSISILEIKKHYHFNYKFATPQEINDAVLNSDTKYAYLVSMPYEMHAPTGAGAAQQVVCIRLIVDALNGNILSSLGSHVRESDTNLFIAHDFDTCEHVKK